MMHRSLLPLLLALTGAPALAYGPPPTALAVTNHTGADVTVWVDGDLRGVVRAQDDRTFTTLPGHHAVVAAWPDGTIVHEQRLVTTPARPATVQVLAVASLRLMHGGAVPVWVELPGVAPFWLVPGDERHVDLPVLPGRETVALTTSVSGLRGLVPLQTWPVALMPGRIQRLDIGYTPATTVTLTNLEQHTVRIFIGGAEVAAIGVGQTRTFDVSPGRFDVTVIEHHDGILFQRPVTFDPRRDHQIVLSGGTGTLQVSTTVTQNRPYPDAPPRPPPRGR